jgi:uncharacterized protein (TIGR02001 family)
MLAVAMLSLAAPALAQVSASATATSDYQYRGVSLSNGMPALSVNVAYDDASGLYFGASATGEATAHSGAQMLGYVEYLGFAGRANPNLTWDVGVINQSVNGYDYGPYKVRDTEIFGGLHASRASYYIYFSPNYFGDGVSTLYLEADPALQLARRWRLFGHAGVLTPLGGRGGPDSRREQWDFRAGVAVEFKAGEVQLAWSARLPGADYLAGHLQNHDVVVVAATCFF